MNTGANLSHDQLIALIPEYVLGVLDADDRSVVDDHLGECVSCAAEVQADGAIHHLAASGTIRPAARLRESALGSAFASRAPAVTYHDSGDTSDPGGFSSLAFAAWEAETGRFLALLDHPLLGPRLEAGESAWDLLCIEKFALSVRSTVCHLIASESLRAELLGDPVEAIPETSRNIERRTLAVIDRHAGLPITDTIGEIDRVLLAVSERLRSLHSSRNQRPSDLAPAFTTDEYTALRALETWTHADDIRHVLGDPEQSPEATNISTMTAVLPQWISFVLSSDQSGLATRNYQIELTGPGGRTIDVAPAAGPSGPQFTMSCDAVEFCKLAGARRDPATFSYTAATHPVEARELVHAMAQFELI